MNHPNYPIRAFLRSHLRANVIGYFALFVALGGTSYAAVNIPNGSVGTRQLRNGVVTANKLNRHSIPGYVAFWAHIYNTGAVLASSQPTKTEGWGGLGGTIVFQGNLPKNCFPLANVTSGGGPLGGYVTNVDSSSRSGRTEISLGFAEPGQSVQAPIAVDVAEICP